MVFDISGFSFFSIIYLFRSSGVQSQQKVVLCNESIETTFLIIGTALFCFEGPVFIGKLLVMAFPNEKHTPKYP